jgi:hypothetical protein
MPWWKETRCLRAAVKASLVAALVTAAVGVLTACGGQGSSTNAACASVVEWRGATYYGTTARQPLTLGEALDGGAVPLCNDTNTGNEETGSQPVALASIDGLPAEQAVATDPSTLYVAAGYFPQLPGTPLHDAIYGSRSDVPDERGTACHDAQTKELQGAIRNESFGNLWLDRRRDPIFTEARTVVEGGGSPPHVKPGDSVRAHVLVCRKKDEPHFLKVVVTRLTIGE